MSNTLKRKAPPTPSSSAKKTRSITSFFAPQASSSSDGTGVVFSSCTVPAFDKEAWVATLSAEQKTLLSLEMSTLGESYLSILASSLTTPQFLGLKRFLAAESGTVYPPAPQIYTWSRLCPLPTVRVVVLGQDPYHGPKQAMGLSFSVNPPAPAPPSLVNIYKALANDYPEFQPPPARGGDLTPWAKRGVLMLNACLTVRRGEANSHAGKGWETITAKVLKHIAKGKGCVFMAWGAGAQARVKEAGVDEKRHLVLRSVHPSPLSAHRGWFDCGHFKKANEWLEARYGAAGPVDWSLHGDIPVGVKRSESSSKAAEKKTVEKKKEETDEFGFEDEEAAMVEAAVEAEKAAEERAVKEKAAEEKAAEEKAAEKEVVEGKAAEEQVLEEKAEADEVKTAIQDKETKVEKEEGIKTEATGVDSS